MARAVAGDDTPRLTPAERHLAVARLTAAGMSARKIAVRLGCGKRTVERARWRARNAAREDTASVAS